MSELQTSTGEAPGQQPPSRLSFEEGVAMLARGNSESRQQAEDAPQAPEARPESTASAIEDGQRDTEEETSPLDPGDSNESEDAPELAESESETDELELPDGVKITREEAVKGYLRNKDYTEKTQRLSEMQKSVVEHEELVSKGANYLLERLPQIKAVLESRIPPEPSQDLRQSDPLAYWDKYNERQSILAQIQKSEDELTIVKQYQAELETKKQAEREREETVLLLEKLPSWKNPKTAKIEKAEIFKYATSLGFTPEEISKFNHKMVIALRDGAIGKRVREGGSKATVKREPQPVGSSQTRPLGSSAVSRQTQDLRNAAQSGTRRDRLSAGVALLQGNRK